MTVRMIHTADWHLGYFFRTFGETAEKRLEDQRLALLQIVKLAVDHNADAMLVAGDIFDSTKPDKRAQAIAQEIFDFLSSAGIPAFAIPGTHDHLGFANAQPIWRHDNLYWFNQAECAEPVSVETDDETLWIYGIASVSGERAEWSTLKRRDLPGVHAALLHATVTSNQNMPISLKDLPVIPATLDRLNLDYIALGHFHNYKDIYFEGRRLGCYCGTPAALRFGETGPRYALLVEFEKEKIVINPVELAGAQTLDIRLDISTAPDDESIARQISAYRNDQNYARFRFSGIVDHPLDISRLHRMTVDGFAYLELIDETDLARSERITQLANEPTVRGHAISRLLQLVEQTDDPLEKNLHKRALAHLIAAFDRHAKELPL